MEEGLWFEGGDDAMSSMAAWLQRFRDSYWRRVTIAIGVVCWSLFIIGFQVDTVSEALVKSGAIQLLILTLLLELSAALVVTRPNRIWIAGDESENSARLLGEVRSRSVPDADFLEFSGVAVEGMIHDLAERGCRVRLLVKHPETVGGFQTRRIVANLEALFGRPYMDRIEVRCYKFNASLRGRRYGNQLINLGWYTPFIKDGVLARFEVMGHDNALITAELGTPEGRSLVAMFQEVFDSLWNAKDTESAKDVLERMDKAQAND